jgi:hypothetical protein
MTNRRGSESVEKPGWSATVRLLTWTGVLILGSSLFLMHAVQENSSKAPWVAADDPAFVRVDVTTQPYEHLLTGTEPVLSDTRVTAEVASIDPLVVYLEVNGDKQMTEVSFTVPPSTRFLSPDGGTDAAPSCTSSPEHGLPQHLEIEVVAPGEFRCIPPMHFAVGTGADFGTGVAVWLRFAGAATEPVSDLVGGSGLRVTATSVIDLDDVITYPKAATDVTVVVPEHCPCGRLVDSRPQADLARGAWTFSSARASEPNALEVDWRWASWVVPDWFRDAGLAAATLFLIDIGREAARRRREGERFRLTPFVPPGLFVGGWVIALVAGATSVRPVLWTAAVAFTTTVIATLVTRGRR